MIPSLLYTFTRLALPDLWADLAQGGMTSADALSWLSWGIELPVTVDDYERYIDDLRAAHPPITTAAEGVDG